MGSMRIKCNDCEEKRKEIEEAGRNRVVSCDPLEGEEDKPESERMCEIVWEPIPI